MLRRSACRSERFALILLYLFTYPLSCNKKTVSYFTHAADCFQIRDNILLCRFSFLTFSARRTENVIRKLLMLKIPRHLKTL